MELIRLEVKVGNDQEMAQSKTKSNSKNEVGKKKLNHVPRLRKHIVSRVRSCFPNRRSLSHQHLTTKNVHKVLTGKIFNTQKTIRTTKELAPWNDP